MLTNKLNKNIKIYLSLLIALFFLLTLISFSIPKVQAETVSQSYGWTRSYGSTGNDSAGRLTRDANGNFYIIGTFQGTVNFSPTGTDNHTSNGDKDFYITKWNADETYAWTKTIGGTGEERAGKIKTDLNGNVYATGSFENTVDFDPNAGTDNHTSGTRRDIFITKWNADGTYGWTRTMGDWRFDAGIGITTDKIGNVYATGVFRLSVNFNPLGSDVHVSNNQFGDIYITKWNADGTYGWTQTMGGTYRDWGLSVATDSNNNVYASGYFNNTVNFNPTGSDIHTSTNNNDIFITKWNADGTYGWTKTMGGNGYNEASMIVLDSKDNIYVGGLYSATINFNPTGSDIHTSAGGWDIYVTKWNADGTYGWTQTVGSTSSDVGFGLTVDSTDNIYTSGYFSGTVNFNPTGTDNHTSNGVQDIFITKWNADGTYGWTQTIGGSGFDQSSGIIAGSNGDIYATGRFRDTVDFDPFAGTDNHISNGNYDAFVIKLTQSYRQHVLSLDSTLDAIEIDRDTSV